MCYVDFVSLGIDLLYESAVFLTNHEKFNWIDEYFEAFRIMFWTYGVACVVRQCHMTQEDFN